MMPRCRGMIIGLSPDWKMNIPTTKLSTAMKILAKNAVQKPETLNPGTSADTSIIMSALMTSRNPPKVISVNGMVSRIIIGLMTALAKPNSNADINSDRLLEKEMP